MTNAEKLIPPSRHLPPRRPRTHPPRRRIGPTIGEGRPGRRSSPPSIRGARRRRGTVAMAAKKPGASTRLTGECECGSGGSGCLKSGSRGRSPGYGSGRLRRPRWRREPTTWRPWPSRAARPTSTSPSWQPTSPAPRARHRKTSRRRQPWRLPSTSQQQDDLNPRRQMPRSQMPRIQPGRRTITATRSTTFPTSCRTSATE